MLVCDQTFQQAITGKWCVIGTHDTVVTMQVPFVHLFAVFVSLGDFESGSRFQIVIRHEAGDVVCQVDAEAGTPEQLTSFDVGVQLPQLTLPKSGDYLVDLRAAGKVIASRTLRVLLQTP
jgi:hypothetical protein